MYLLSCPESFCFTTSTGVMCRLLVTSLLLFVGIISGIADEIFYENLLIKPINENKVAYSFEYTFELEDLKNAGHKHFRLFPKQVYNLVREYDVIEASLSVTNGFWDSTNWQMYPFHSTPNSANLAVWFDGDYNTIESRWIGISKIIPSLLCTSIKDVNTSSISPLWSFNPVGLVPSSWHKNLSRESVFSNDRRLLIESYFRYSTLSNEPYCTENLTPWLKLLPCRQLTGISQLLNPENIVKFNYLSMGLDYHSRCAQPECNTVSRRLSLHLTVVFDKNFLSIPDFKSFSLANSFDRIIADSCSLANSSKLVFHALDASIITIDLLDRLRKENYINFEVPNGRSFIRGAKPLPPIDFQKLATGSGNVRGGVELIIKNRSPRVFRAVVMEHFFWAICLNYHTLRITRDGQTLQPIALHFKGAKTRGRPAHLEVMLDLVPMSVTKIRYQFDKNLLRWTEYSPDSSHGHYLAPALLSVRPMKDGADYNESLSEHYCRVFSNTPSEYKDYYEWITSTKFRAGHCDESFQLHSVPVLVSMPLPDFSMPFNTLCLVCSTVLIGILQVQRFSTSYVVVQKSSRKAFKLSSLLGFGQNEPENVTETETFKNK